MDSMWCHMPSISAYPHVWRKSRQVMLLSLPPARLNNRSLARSATNCTILADIYGHLVIGKWRGIDYAIPVALAPRHYHFLVCELY